MSSLDPITWAVILLLVGCALVVLEVFLPSGGILSFLSVTAIIASLVVAFRRDTTTGLGFMVLAVIAVPAVVALAFKYWPQTPMGKAFLGELPTAEELATDDPRRELVGRVGIAKSKMLPSGAIEVDDRLIDAVSQGAAIDSGQAIVVVEVQGNRVVVRLADEQESRQAMVNPSEILSQPIEELGLESFDEPLG
jgi:membrane-bound ClpP family serine protease